MATPSNTLTMQDRSTRLSPLASTGRSRRSQRNWRNGSGARSSIRRIASICTGAFLLAAAGLLDGRRVATHWLWCEVLQAAISSSRWNVIPSSSKEDKYYTTAGVTAGIDLSLALVEEDLGHTVAAESPGYWCSSTGPGGQSQQSTLLAQQEDIEDARMRDLPVWVKAHLSRKLDVEDLAKAAVMSPRTFMRQFKAQFNTTPARWLKSLRVEARFSIWKTVALR